MAPLCYPHEMEVAIIIDEYVKLWKPDHMIPGQVSTSLGLQDEYFDAFGMILTHYHVFKRYYTSQVGDAYPVGLGRSGALILGMLGRGTLYNGDKPYGITAANFRLRNGLEVALVDDCIFTHKTMDRLRTWVESLGCEVVKEVAIWRAS